MDGTYYRAYYLARELVRLGHEVTLGSISPWERFRLRVDGQWGIRLVEFPNWGNRLLKLWGASPLDTALRTRLLLTSEFDIVHGFEYFPDVTVPIALTRRSKHFLFVSDWADWFSKGMALRRSGLWTRAIRLVAAAEDTVRRRAHGVTAISSVLLQHCRSLGLAESRLLHLPGGAPIDLIQPIPAQQAKERQGLPRDLRVFGFMGNSQDDLDLLLEAFRIVYSQVPATRLLIIGRKTPVVAQWIAERELMDTVLMTGYVAPEELGRWLCMADTLMLPLRDHDDNRARWPNKIGDYLAAGRPIIANRVGDAAMLIEAERVGLVTDQSPKSIAEAMLQLLAHPQQALEMGVRARCVAETKLSWRALALRLDGFYRKLSA